ANATNSAAGRPRSTAKPPTAPPNMPACCASTASPEGAPSHVPATRGGQHRPELPAKRSTMNQRCYETGPAESAPAPSPDDPFRRRLLTAALLAGGGQALAGLPLAALAAGRAAAPAFLTPLPTSTADSVAVAAECRVELLYAWGDPISGGPR